MAPFFLLSIASAAGVGATVGEWLSNKDASEAIDLGNGTTGIPRNFNQDEQARFEREATNQLEADEIESESL
jgi:hypothetical protein